jgi:tripartite-type tricarboxylate transporter receptor subunit TctC
MRSPLQLVALAAIAALFLPGTPSHGQSYPAQNIVMIVGFPGGGIADVMTRTVAAKMSDTLGVTVITVPTPGAGGTLAMQKVAQAAPDGYTLMMVPTGTLLARPHQMGLPVSYRNFTPVANVALASTTISVKLDHRWKTFADFVADARQNPGKYTYASPAVGGIPHLGTEVAAATAGLKLVHVPYPGGPQAIQAAISGQVDLVLGDSVHPQIRALATLLPERSPYEPDVPTLRELGVDAAFPVKYSIVGPGGLSGDIVRRLETAVQAALKTPEVMKQMETQKLIIKFETGATLAAEWPKEEAKYVAVIDRLGLAASQQKTEWKN